MVALLLTNRLLAVPMTELVVPINPSASVRLPLVAAMAPRLRTPGVTVPAPVIRPEAVLVRLPETIVPACRKMFPALVQTCAPAEPTWNVPELVTLIEPSWFGVDSRINVPPLASNVPPPRLATEDT